MNKKELELVKSEKFNDLECNFYKDEKGEIFVTRNQIGQALEYLNPVDAIKDIHNRHKARLDKFSRGVQIALPSGGVQKIYIYNARGIYEICRHSHQPKADAFCDWVYDVLENIRKTGGYIAGEENMNEDELVLKAMTVLNKKVENLKEENKNLLAENNQKDQLIGELKPKADYTDRILQSHGTTKVNVIANDYGYTAIDFNKLLHRLGIQYKQGEDWLLYREYRGKGYTHSKTFNFKRKNGMTDSKTNMEWTQKGRLFLYEKLKKHDIVPMIENN